MIIIMNDYYSSMRICVWSLCLCMPKRICSKTRMHTSDFNVRKKAKLTQVRGWGNI